MGPFYEEDVICFSFVMLHEVVLIVDAKGTRFVERPDFMSPCRKGVDACTAITGFVQLDYFVLMLLM